MAEEQAVISAILDDSLGVILEYACNGLMESQTDRTTVLGLLDEFFKLYRDNSKFYLYYRDFDGSKKKEASGQAEGKDARGELKNLIAKSMESESSRKKLKLLQQAGELMRDRYTNKVLFWN